MKNQIQATLAEHEQYWSNKKSHMSQLKKIYEVEYYSKLEHKVEVADAFSYIERYIASLFLSNPSVEVQSRVASADARKAIRTACNDFLEEAVREIQNASRIGLIYPAAYLKLVPQDSDNPLARVSVESLLPWDVIVDRDAKKWNTQRYCGHIYHITMKEAQERFAGVHFIPSTLTPLLEKPLEQAVDDNLKYVKIVEFYNLQENKLIIYSTDAKEPILLESDIPTTTVNGGPLTPIIPLCFSWKPDRPLEGLSALSRIYDQISEKNELRTHFSTSIRNDGRIWLMEKGSLSDDQLSAIQEAKDGDIIPVDNPNAIKEIPQSRLSQNYKDYLEYIERDLEKSSVVAPFTAGEATKATATEVQVLATYTASELGRMAKARDEAVEALCRLYIRTLVLQVEDEEDILVVMPDDIMTLTIEDLEHPYKFYIENQGSTPLSEYTQKTEFVQLIPTLRELGIPQDVIVERLLKLFKLPTEWANKIPEQPAEEGAMSPRQIDPSDIPNPGGTPLNPTGVR